MQVQPARSSLGDRANHHARHATEAASPWLERLGRFGYAAKGLVYAIVGVLAAQAAIGSGGATTGTQGALRWVVQAPFGRFLLLAIGAGILGYAIWRFVQAGLDTEGKGTDTQGLAARGAYAVIGVIHVGLALSAVQLALGNGGSASGGATQDWTAWLLSQPFGAWLVGLAGAVVTGAGLLQFWKAYSANLRDTLKLGELSATGASWAVALGRFGYAARGVAFSIIGGFLIVAAVQAQPQEARGLGGALDTLASQPFGPWLLAIVAGGLVAHGAFMLVQARYRRLGIR